MRRGRSGVRQPRPSRRLGRSGEGHYHRQHLPVPEISRLGRTLTAWRTEFLARFDEPEVSNGPTECLTLKNTKRAARGYRSFDNYRLRLLLNHGLIREDQQTTRIRSRRPRLIA